MDQNEEHNEEEIEREAPALFGIPKQDGFEVPDGYFDSLAGNISSFVEREEARERIRLQDEAGEIASAPASTLFERLIGILKPRVLAPTLVMIAVAAGGYFYMNPGPTDPTIDEEIMLSALDNIDDFEDFDFDLTDEDFFAEAYSDESIDALLAEDAALGELGEDALMDYLIDNDIDLETIIDEL
jgi:hypothetical protein